MNKNPDKNPDSDQNLKTHFHFSIFSMRAQREQIEQTRHLGNFIISP